MRNLVAAGCLVVLWTATAGCGSAAPASLDLAHFDEAAAWTFLQAQVDFGPRNPGSSGHEACRQYLLARLEEYLGQPVSQDFVVQVDQDTLSLSNIIATYNPAGSPHVLLCAHWDTRPRAEHDPDPAKVNDPIPGANDGASGVAILLELAHVLSTTTIPYRVSIVLFDGEDYGITLEDYLLGSSYYAAHLPSNPPTRGILLDMVGDKDLDIYQEQYSLLYASSVVNAIWTKAAALKETAFVPQVGYAIYDDHLPLNQAGVPTADLIDFDYPYWHTTQDTPDKCSPSSLGAVGRVVLATLTEGLL
jgi:glutaminyl-peptide cyclotransferase